MLTWWYVKKPLGFKMLMTYAFFSVIPRRLNCICQRFGTLCLFHLHRRYRTDSVPKRWHIKIHTPGICPEESIQYSKHGESLKSRIVLMRQAIWQASAAHVWHKVWVDTAFCNPLKTKRVCFIQGPDAYRAVNTLDLGYTKPLCWVELGKSRSLLWHCTKHIYPIH
jgi:hypothetical protein